MYTVEIQKRDFKYLIVFNSSFLKYPKKDIQELNAAANDHKAEFISKHDAINRLLYSSLDEVQRRENDTHAIIRCNETSLYKILKSIPWIYKCVSMHTRDIHGLSLDEVIVKKIIKSSHLIGGKVSHSHKCKKALFSDNDFPVLK
jgi:hypothetical protein